MTVRNAPERVFLTYGDVDADTEHADCSDVTWCQDRIGESDVPYVRADTHDALRAEVERLRADNAELRTDILAVATALGTTYEPEQGPVYPGTLTDMLLAIRNKEAEVAALTQRAEKAESGRDVLRTENEKMWRRHLAHAGDPRLALTKDDLLLAAWQLERAATNWTPAAADWIEAAARLRAAAEAVGREP